MQIALIGPGGIGSTFAFQLSRAGHEITVVARGKRLEQLQRSGAIEKTSGERAPVHVTATLDPAVAWDLVLVTVLASQVDAVLPALAASSARKVMFMFNTFESPDRLKEAVGGDRFVFGFPAILASLDDEGRLTSKIVTRGQISPVTDPFWAGTFTAAGIPAMAEKEMFSWLRTHATLVVPIMVMSGVVHQRGAGISLAEAKLYSRALHEGLHLVRELGQELTPASMRRFTAAPVFLLAALLWFLSRLSFVRKMGAAGFGEPRTLIDQMLSAARHSLPALEAIRPE